MTHTAEPPSPQPDDRSPLPSPMTTWGPLVLVVVLLIVVGTVATIQGGPVTSRTSGSPAGDTGGPEGSNPKSWAKNPVLPVTYEDARKAGTLDDYD